MAMPHRSQPDERVKHRKALELRLEGKTYAEIADELGYADESGAYRAVEAVLKRVESAGAAELRKVETLRLEALFRAWWPAALARDEKAAGVVLRCHDRLVKLHGLAVPERVVVAQMTHLDKGIAAQEITELMAALGYVEPVTPIEPDAYPGAWSNIE
ncbi:hypothetical protein ACFVH4_13790 [Nocardia ignorata]|uniref:hypothetical protein n=1 Tax=Nocardia ignorata TaxID=145285 RepID=UPI003635FD15